MNSILLIIYSNFNFVLLILLQTHSEVVIRSIGFCGKLLRLGFQYISFYIPLNEFI